MRKKMATRQSTWLAILCVALACGSAAGELPIPCASCGNNHVGFSAPNVAGAALNGNTLTVTQHPERAILNWQSFNIGRDNAVRFEQPSSNAIALNRIYQSDPSRILGQLSANGQIYLINQNGIVFGQTARVNTGSLVASALDMRDNVFSNLGITGAINDPAGAKPAFETTNYLGAGPAGAVTIENGAQLRAANGGRILVFAPKIEHRGTIETPEGQTILAAAEDKVYLAAADGDPNLRGLLVEVETGGTVLNEGQISAPRGNATLLGFAVNQNGRANATTSVSVNGSIRLLARDKLSIIRNDAKRLNIPTALRTGTISLGANSRTEVTAEQGAEQSAVGAAPQPQSRIEIMGNSIRAVTGAAVVARGGAININARANPSNPQPGSPRASVVFEAGSKIDASGLADAVLPLERNLVKVELRGNELRDAPLQKNGALRGKTVTFDIRKGTKLADVSGAVAGLKRPINERLASGGDVRIQSDDELVVETGAAIDVSGGQVSFLKGQLNTSKLIAAGRVYDIGDADPNRVYAGIFGETSVLHAKWGVREKYTLYANETPATEPGYIEGKDAGTLSLAAPNLSIDGALLGRRVEGKFQRNAPGSLKNFQRPFNELPLAGLLTLGSDGEDHLLTEVLLSSSVATGAHTSMQGSKPLVSLAPRFFLDGGFFRAAIFANGRINVPAGTLFETASAGALDLTAGQVNFAGIAKLPSGSVTLHAEPTNLVPNDDSVLTLQSGAQIDTRGLWINDRVVGERDPTAVLGPRLINGGTISLNATGDIHLQLGSVLDVGGGGQLTSKGKFVAGNGGAISILGDSVNPSKFELSATLRGFAFAEGGSLKLTGPGFLIGGDATARNNANRTHLEATLFSEGGFKKIEVSALRSGIELLPRTPLDFRLRNRLPIRGFENAPSDTNIDAVSQIGLLEASQRLPINLSLNYQRRPNIEFDAGSLEVGTGSVIRTDPQAAISLVSDTVLNFDGKIFAPSSKISFKLVKPRESNDRGFNSQQAITVGAHAQLLAPGVFTPAQNETQTRQGDVLGGGTISVSGQRGYVIAESGSLFDVSGVSTILDLRDPNDPSHTKPTTVSASGGRIELKAAEGIVLNGTVRGEQGGTLAFVLDPFERETAADLTGLPQFPTSSRDILLGSRAIADIPFGDEIPLSRNGLATLDPARVSSGGFATLELRTRPVLSATTTAAIRFDNSLTLSLPDAIYLDAPAISATGGDIRIRAPYLALGSTNDQFRRAVPALAGAARIFAEADQLDIFGDLSLQGFGGTVNFASRGDIRLIGTRVPPNTSTEITGSLTVAADLALSAARIYPSTLSNFQITAAGANRQITLSGISPEIKLPLTAAGSVTLAATTIVQGGYLLAPFGQLNLNAIDSLTLTAGSVTSVAGSDTLVPFGQTQFGTDWVYPFDIVTREFKTLPEKRVNVSGQVVNIAAGAIVDVSGGGDLLAHEHIPGPGGSANILNGDNLSGAFAVIPTLGTRFAPFDPIESSIPGLSARTIIEVSGGSLLPAGHYAVLPARYALLPGAFLVTPAAGINDVIPGLVGQSSNGLPLIAGRIGTAGLGARDAQWSGFRVETGPQFRQRAEYRETLASQFFGPHTLNTTSGIATRLPADAGLLSVTARRSLTLAGRLRSTTEARGRGAELDIVAETLAVVNEFTGASQRVEVKAQDLAAFGAESILLGGRRHEVDQNTVIDVRASDVSVESGADLRVTELLLAATGNVIVKQGARIAATGVTPAQPNPLVLTGDSAFLRVSSGAQIDVTRTGALRASGSVSILDGASLFADGSIALDGSRDAMVAGNLATNHGSLRFASSRISLGDALGVTTGLVLTNAKLTDLLADELIFDSRSSLDIYGPVNIATKRLSVNAAGIGGFSDPRASAAFIAERVNFTNSAARVSSELSNLPTVPGSSFAVRARELNVGPGTFVLGGFDSTLLSATEQLTGSGQATVSTHGDLHLAAGRLTTSNGADLSYHSRNIAVDTFPLTTASARNENLGGKISIEGEQISFGGRVELPSGNLRLVSNGVGGITIRPGAVIDVAGRPEIFADKRLGTPGGRVLLRATAGPITLQAGTHIDVSGAQSGGDAGAVTLSASAGTVALEDNVGLSAVSISRGGVFALDSTTLSGLNFAALNDMLNANGFTERRELRLRTGNLTLGVEALIRAHDVTLTADAGAIEIQGRIDAHGAEAGRIALSARDALTLRGTARLDAHATAIAELGGVVLLSTQTGSLNLEATDQLSANGIDVAGTLFQPDAFGRAIVTNTGHVQLRAPRTVGNDDIQVTVVAPTINGARRVDLEGFRVYTNTNASSAFPNALTEASTYMSHAAAIETRLNRNLDALFHVVPGIEIRSAGSLALLSDLDLSGTRFNGEPGVLTLRAANSLNLSGSLSDGIAEVALEVEPGSGEFLPARNTVQVGPSWSFNLVAGADLLSADMSSVRLNTGDIVISANKHARTGSGSIGVSSGGNLTFSGAGSALYTFGENRGTGTFDPLITELLMQADYLRDGGNIRVTALGHIRGVATPILPDWISRIGGPNLQFQLGERPPVDVPTAWGIKPDAFQQGIGALGGGQVNVKSDGDLENIIIAIPTTGQPIQANGVPGINVAGLGKLEAEIGGDIRSGMFLLGQGNARLTAQGEIRQSLSAPIATVLELGDGKFNLHTGHGLTLETVLNPTFTPVNPAQGATDLVGSASSVFFSTYSPISTVNLSTLNGDTVLLNRSAGIVAPYGDRSFDTGTTLALTLYPGTLRATTYRGNLRLDNSLILAPASIGQLELLADGALSTSAVQARIRLLDVESSLLPTPLHSLVGLSELSDLLLSNVPGIGHSAAPLHVADPEPARLVARHGTLGPAANSRLEITLAKRAILEAGLDILNVAFANQHVDLRDRTKVSAGRDVLFSTLRGNLGNLQPNNQVRFEFSGPGRFDVFAGRDINLGTSGGLLTTGRLLNPALPLGAGSLTLMAGIAREPTYGAFGDRYVRKSDQYLRELSGFLASAAVTPTSDLQADFDGLSEASQHEFLLSVFFNELKESGISASRPTTGVKGYQRGVNAIETLFPAFAQSKGSISSLLSRITTLDNGDINLFAPYGLVNAGAAAATGLAKTPDELGIVVQRQGNISAFVDGDFLVNLARVFALDGGSILIWSSTGNIDAGRGAKTALSIPPPVTTFDASGNAITEFPPAIAGSGIQAAVSTSGLTPGDVFLFAPRGVVDAGDAGISSAGNLTIAATAVLGADNILVGGASTGVPTTAVSVPVGLASASSAASSATKSATAGASDQFKSGADSIAKDLGASLVSMISVQFIGFGE